MGSLAHRARNYWTNLCLPAQLSAALRYAERPANRTVSMALPAHREALPVARSDPVPQFPCNQIGEPRAAWPTLMGRAGSYAFRPGQAGSVLDYTLPAQPCWTEPTAEEREFALGYLPGSTAAEGVTEQQRRKALGQCIDANALQAIIATSKAWWFRSAQTSPAAAAVSCANSSSTAVQQSEDQPYSISLACALAAETQDKEAAPAAGAADIWQDAAALQVLQSGVLPQGISVVERHRLARRAKQYSWEQGKLYRRMPDSSLRLVPPPADRANIIIRQHELCGHFGIRRTAAMVLSKYWWHGLLADAAHIINRCEHCKRVQASFTAKPPELQSIPVSSIGYRWHVDTAGPLTTSERGHQYFMVAVEAFTKYLEVVPIPDKKASTLAYAFLHNVLARYGAPAQVVTDNGGEFEGEFQQLLLDAMIDHRHTSPAHPQANGQAEKAVHVVKTALTKMSQARKSLTQWDQDVAWLALGYRCTPQSSTGYSPYELMFARPPVVPPAVKEALAPAISYDDPAAAAQDLLLRKDLVQKMCPMALDNLTIAQHRDQRRYLQTRAPDYEPKQRLFQPGQYVYLQQLNRSNTLQPRARTVILRVVQLKPSGVLMLQGRCGRTVDIHMSHCAPCPIRGIDGDIDPLLKDFDYDTPCEVCSSPVDNGDMLLCDICDSGYHLHCLQPALSAVPEGYWICPKCKEQGYTADEAASREQQREQLAEREAQPNMFPSPATRKRDEEARKLDGRLIKQPFRDPAIRRHRDYWGKLHYRGPEHRPYYFQIVWEDGNTNAASMRGVKRWLQPESAVPPASVQFLPPEALAAAVQNPAAAHQRLQSDQQLMAAAAHRAPIQIPAVDLQTLLQCLQFSLAQEVCNPLSDSEQWQPVLGNFCHTVHNGRPQHSASVVFTAVTGSHAEQLLEWLMSLPAALVVCYLDSTCLLGRIAAAIQQYRDQQRSTFITGQRGAWLVIALGSLPLEHWLQKQ